MADLKQMLKRERLLKIWVSFKMHRKRVARRIGRTVIIMVFGGLITSGPVFAGDLFESYLKAAETSPVLKQARAMLDVNRADRQRAKAALMPKVTAGGQIRRENADIKGFGEDFSGPALPGDVFQDINETYTGGSYSVTLVQPLVDGQAWSAKDAAENLVRAGQAAVMAAEQDLTARVIEAYFNVLNARSRLRVAESRKKLLSEILDQARAALNVGSGDIISVQEAKARYDAAESGLISAKNQVQIARRELERLTHEPVGQITDVCVISPEGPAPASIGPWLETAKSRQPALMEASRMLASAEDQVRIAGRARWPDLDLNAGYGYSKGDFMPSVETKKARVGLMVRLPIYLGGEIGASVARARSEAAAARFQLEDMQDQVMLNVETAFVSLQNSVARFEAAAQALTSSEVSLAATRKGYEVGTRTVVDLLSATQDHTDVRQSYYQSLYDHILARVRLKWAAGVLSQKDVADINSLLICN